MAFLRDICMDNIRFSIEINNSGGECIGVKQGEYYFENSALYKCGDRAVSSGELANTKINNLKINFAKVGLYAKDTSIISVEKGEIEEVDLCILSTRTNINYSGSLIQTNKRKFFCDQDNEINQSSQWLNN